MKTKKQNWYKEKVILTQNLISKRNTNQKGNCVKMFHQSKLSWMEKNYNFWCKSEVFCKLSSKYYENLEKYGQKISFE